MPKKSIHVGLKLELILEVKEIKGDTVILKIAKFRNDRLLEAEVRTLRKKDDFSLTLETHLEMPENWEIWA